MAVPQGAFVWGPNGQPMTPEQVALQRELLARKQSKGVDFSPVGHWSQGAARVVDALGGVLKERRLNAADAANTAYDAEQAGALGKLLSGGAAYPSSVAAGGSTTAPEATGVQSGAQVAPEIRDGIVQTATSLGIDPVDLATAISYETGGTFDPTKAGPTTKWGQHKGFIQFGEPQAKQYGVDWNNPVGSQLGPDGAVAKYLRDRGVKPGMGMMDIYSTINAGAPGLYNRSDAAAGGAPGTVADKVNEQMAGHRAKAQALFATQNASLGGGSMPPSGVMSPNPNPTVAESVMVQPSSQPTTEEVVAQQLALSAQNGYVDGQAVDPAQQQQMAMATEDQGVGVAGIPAGTGGTPVLDVTQQPELSAAAGLPIADSGAPVAAPITGQQRVAQALQAYPVREQAAAGDQMVAGAEQTLQPEMAPQQQATPEQANPVVAAVRAMSDPRTSPQTKAVAQLIIKRAQAQEQAQQEQAVWQQRQAFEAAQRENDPLRQAQIKIAQQKASSGTQQPLINAGNGNVFNPNTNEWMTAPNVADGKPPPVEDFYDEKTGQPYKAQWNKETKEWDRVGGAKAPSGMSITTNPDGTVSVTQGSGKALTEGQSKDVVFGTRASGSLPIIDALGDNLTSLGQSVGGSAPLIGNYLKSPEYQKAEQAGTEFLQAILRKDTGAAITPQETAEYGKVYLPRPGDSPGLLAQKKESRKRAVAALKAGVPANGILMMEKALAETNAGGLPDGVTEDDIAETMRANNMTREQVLERINGGS